MTQFLLIISILFFPLSAFSSPAEEGESRRFEVLDKTQEILGTKANFLANRLDSFFATERADDEFGRSRIRIRTNFDVREREKSDLNIRYRINIRLPKLEERFKWKFENGEDKAQTEESKKVTEQAPESTWAYPLIKDWIFNSDLGISAAIPPRLIARARLRRNFPTGDFIHRFVEQVTYITDDSGLVEETSLESDRIIKENLIFRFINAKIWRIIDKDFSTTHGPTFLHQLSPNDALSYGLTMSSIIDESVWFVDNYQAYVNYRRNLYRQWAFLDIIPGIDFPKSWSFRRTPFISFQIELLFGGF